MRRTCLAVIVSLFLLIAVSQAQKPARPLTDEGLQTAKIPHRFEPPSPTATLQELEQRADDYRREKAYADAIDYYRAALGHTKEKTIQARLHNKVGISELQLQHIKEAKKNFERAAKYDRNLAEALNNLGATLYLQKDYSGAVEKYKKALLLREDDASFHNNLGTAYFMRKELPKAMAEYARALELDPEVFDRVTHGGVSAQLQSPKDRARYNYILARMYALNGDMDRSIRYLRKAMEDGYKNIKDVYKDKEFAVLRKDERFSQLMAEKPLGIPDDQQ